VALDCWGGSAAGHTPEEVEEARFDDGVGRVFPRMKAFEAVCDAAKIKFPGAPSFFWPLTALFAGVC